MPQGQGTGTDPELPQDINTDVAHPARVYDYWLGGKDNFPPTAPWPSTSWKQSRPCGPWRAANRAFLSRAVRPIVLAHARALLTSQEAGETSFIGADLQQPKSILDHPTLTSTLDLSQPVAVMLVAVLMYFRDTDNPNPFEMVTTLLEAMPPGSYLAITHPTADFNAEAMGGAVAAAERSGVTLVPRNQAETEEFFAGLDVVDPGVTPVLSWRPDKPPDDPRSAYYWAGIARKP